MVVIPVVVPPLPHENRWARNLPAATAFKWLAQGWQDFRTVPGPSIAYGMLIFLLSAAIIDGLFLFGRDYILFPALAGFMVMGPLLAVVGGHVGSWRTFYWGAAVVVLDLPLATPDPASPPSAASSAANLAFAPKFEADMRAASGNIRIFADGRDGVTCIAGLLVFQERVDSPFYQNRFCDSFRQYAYEKIISCPLFEQYRHLNDPNALLRRLNKINALP